MSYSVSIYIWTGNGEALYQDVGNYTYNVAPMYYEAAKQVRGDEIDFSLNNFDGCLCAHCADLFRSIVSEMRDNVEKYRGMDPENGWGDYYGAVEFLERIADTCTKHPKARLRVC